MSYFLPEGSKIYMSSGFAAAKAVSAVSNANPAVATSTAHGYVDNDEVLFSSGWEDANDTIWRVDQSDANTHSFLGLDASDTAWFAAGGGVGNTYKVSGWTELTQWLDVQAQGGDARIVNIEPIGKRNAIAMPAGFNATQINLTFGYDPALASQLAMIAASRTLAKRGFKMNIAGGGTAYFYGHISLSEMPQIQRGQPLSIQASVAVLGRFISY